MLTVPTLAATRGLAITGYRRRNMAAATDIAALRPQYHESTPYYIRAPSLKQPLLATPRKRIVYREMSIIPSLIQGRPPVLCLAERAQRRKWF